MNIFNEMKFLTKVYFRMECFCGITKPSQTQRLPDSRCNMKCPGNPRHSCGGYLAINVLWTGIQSEIH